MSDILTAQAETLGAILIEVEDYRVIKQAKDNKYIISTNTDMFGWVAVLESGKDLKPLSFDTIDEALAYVNKALKWKYD